LIATADLATIAVRLTKRSSALPERTGRLVVGFMIALLAVPGAVMALADLREMIEEAPSAFALAVLLGHPLSTLFLLGAAACTALCITSKRRTRSWHPAVSAPRTARLLPGLC